jgi:uroporphyrinogen decarboxylase
MNPRERVIAALNHQEPGRVPVDLAATTVTNITYPAYHNLRGYLGLPPDDDLRLAHVHQGVVVPCEDLLRRFNVDFRSLIMPKSPRGTIARRNDDGSFIDEYDILWKPAACDYSPMTAPLAKASLEDLKTAVWPDPTDPSRVEGLRVRAKYLYENTDYALVGDIIDRGPFELAVKLRGYEQFFTDLALDPTFAEALLDKITETLIALWDLYLAEIGDYVQVVCQGDDLGMQKGLFISPKMYRRFIKPCHSRIYSYIHSRTDAKVFMHSCGSIIDIIPDLIEAGVDILNPVQYGAKGMGLENLKRQFGKDLCFWGGAIETQQILPYAGPAEIETEIRRNLEIMAAAGGYVFALTHNIQPDISPEKIVSAYEAVVHYSERII